MSDLIDRAQAQTELQFVAKRYTAAHEAHGEGHVVWSDNLISVADAMNALRNVPSAELGTNLAEVGADCISRQAAIDALTEYGNGRAVFISVGEAVIRIEQLPSAQSEPHWIPCSERMPKEHEWLGTKRFGTTISDEVYVTFENPKGERFCKHLSFQNGELSAFDKSTIDAFYKGSKPIAWCELPEPFKGVTSIPAECEGDCGWCKPSVIEECKGVTE